MCHRFAEQDHEQERQEVGERVMPPAGWAGALLGRPPRGPRPCPFKTGWLARYARMATSADTGAILNWD